MKDELMKKMEALLAAHKGKQAPPRPQQQEETKMLDARRQFRKLCHDVLLPALQDMADMLRKHGHDCEVEAQKATETATGEELTLNVRLRIFPAGYSRALFRDAEPPYVCVMHDEAQRNARVVAGTSLPDKPRKPTANEYPMDQLTREMIETEVLNILQTILSEG
jgi:hypothetical protein